jgi:16S rRNA C1402 (ribose-2'-O) methylase RsmI
MSREISKMFEQHAHGSVDEILEKIANKEIPMK